MSELLRDYALAAAGATVTLTRGNYFEGKERGEIPEIQAELNSNVTLMRQEALRKVIAGMSLGKDMSSLFPDVLKCIQTSTSGSKGAGGDLETKKLVYLYLLNYAAGQPDLALLAVNSFIKDCSDPKSPLLRALALRTLGSLRVPKLADYLCEPLQRALSDSHPFVRRTAILCIGKVYDLHSDLAEELQLGDQLRKVILAGEEADLTVLGGALTVYSKLQDESRAPFVLDKAMVGRLTRFLLLEGIGEWPLVAILTILAEYDGSELDDAQVGVLFERTLPCLSHANQAVVMAAVRVLLRFGPSHQGPFERHCISQRLSTAFASVLSPGRPLEMQFAALQCLAPVLLEHPEKIIMEPRVFFPLFDEPLYLKRAKIDCLLLAVCEADLPVALDQLQECAKDVSPQLVEMAVGAIGRLSLRFPDHRHTFMSVLLELARPDILFLRQAVCRVLRNVYQSTVDHYSLGFLLEQAPQFDDPEARAAAVWLAAQTSTVYRMTGFDPIAFFSAFDFASETVDVQQELLSFGLVLLRAGLEELRPAYEAVLGLGLASRESLDIRERARLYRDLLESPWFASASAHNNQNDVDGSLPTLDSFHILADDPLLRAHCLANFGLVSGVLQLAEEPQHLSSSLDSSHDLHNAAPPLDQAMANLEVADGPVPDYLTDYTI